MKMDESNITEPKVDATKTVYRWDLDKTYLRTEFDTIKDLLRTAFETPDNKRTVPGAGVLLREIRATKPQGIFILSGSPEQMRKVLEAKLRLDGIEWDDFTLKPSLENLIRGRFRFLKDQVSYKLSALLTQRQRSQTCDYDEVLFGDDAEADAFIYSLYADIAGNRIGESTLQAVLQRARVYEDEVPRIAELARKAPRADTTRRIFIHLERMSSPDVFSEFGRRVCPFYNYFQPALVLIEDGKLSALAALRVGAAIAIEQGFSPDALLASFEDLVKRRYIGAKTGMAIQAALDSFDPDSAQFSRATFGAGREPIMRFAESVASQVADLPDAKPVVVEPIDYVGLFSRDVARAKAGRKRAKGRR